MYASPKSDPAIVGFICITLIITVRISVSIGSVVQRPHTSWRINSVPSGDGRNYFKSPVKSYVPSSSSSSRRIKTTGIHYERDYGFRSADSDDFYDLIVNSRVIADKSLLIRDVLLPAARSSKATNSTNSTNNSSSGKVIVWNEPRGYGKSVNMDMLKRFLQIETDADGRQLSERDRVNRKIFVGGTVRSSSSRFPTKLKPLKIARNLDCMKYHGKFPVIDLNFKTVHGNTFEEVERSLNIELRQLLNQHYGYHKKNNISSSSKYENLFADPSSTNGEVNVRNTTAIRSEYVLPFLCGALRRRYKRKTIVLIDEYDTPVMNFYLQFAAAAATATTVGTAEKSNNTSLLSAASADDHRRKVFELFDRLLRNLLKDNDDLALLVLSGIVPVKYPSLDGHVKKTTTIGYRRHFGFSQEEVDHLLNRAAVHKRTDEIKAWYYGGNMTGQHTYVPWALMKCLQYRGKLGPYWVGNREKWFIKRTVQSDELQDVVQKALTIGKSVLFQPKTDFFLFSNSSSSSSSSSSSDEFRRDLLLSVLAFSGYLIPTMTTTLNSTSLVENLPPKSRFVIPNEETKYIYTSGVLSWICGKLKINNSVYFSLVSLLTDNDASKLERFKVKLNKLLSRLGGSEQQNQWNWNVFYKGFAISLRYVLSLTYSTPSKTYTAEELAPLAMLPKREIMGDDDDTRRRHNALLITYRSTNSSSDLENSARDGLKTIVDKRYHGKLHALGARNVTQLCISFHQQQAAISYKIDSLLPGSKKQPSSTNLRQN